MFHDTSSVWKNWRYISPIPFMYSYITYELAFPGYNCASINMFRMELTQIITWVYKYSLTLTYPPRINIWLILQFQYLQVNSLIPILTLVMDNHAFTYIPIQHWSNHNIFLLYFLELVNSSSSSFLFLLGICIDYDIHKRYIGAFKVV